MASNSRMLLIVLYIASFERIGAQEDPWPPLVSTCDVMPLVVADANKAGSGLIACASTYWPNCETINCEVLSNNDQLEFQLLPCWQHPAMWIKNRAISGVIIFQDIFDSSRIAATYIGGEKVQLNVTAVQRAGLTLGFGVDVLREGANVWKQIIPYRDIPLNQTECNAGGYLPPLCKMILYMEQYIISSMSAVSKDPRMTPMCTRPNSVSCDHMNCAWNNSYMTPIYRYYQFLPCSNPQAVRIIVMVGEAVINTTFQKSEIMQLNKTRRMNVTLDHVGPQTIGLQVDFINLDGVVTEIPYTKLPLETNGCKRKKQKPRPILHSLFQPQTINIHKSNRRSADKTPPTSTPTPVTPLITGCDVIPLMVDSLNKIPNNFLNCSISSSDCYKFGCRVSSNGDNFVVDFQPCTSPPSMQLTVMDLHNVVLFNQSISASDSLNVTFSNGSLEVEFHIEQHTDFLTMGFEAASDLQGDGTNTTLIQYREIPMDRANCPGAITPSPTCATMGNIAQYMNIFFMNITQNQETWNCAVSSDCNTVNCTVSDIGYQSFSILPCELSLKLTDGTNEFTFSKSRMVPLSDSFVLSVGRFGFDASTSALGFEVDTVYIDILNHSLQVTQPMIPFVSIPLNVTGCSLQNNTNHTIGVPLVNSCDLMSHIAKEASATSILGNTFDCSISPVPGCIGVSCQLTPSNEMIVVNVLPCDNPPSVQILISNAKATQTLNFSSSGVQDGAIGGSTMLFNVTIKQHSERKVLGVGIMLVNTTSSMQHNFIPYHAVPLDTTPCPLTPDESLTCTVMDNIAQYLNVYISNITHTPSYCQATRNSLCNTISCGNPEQRGMFDMSFLPCGDSIGFNVVSGNETQTTYNFTIFNSTYIHFNSNVSGAIVLEQQNETVVHFSLDLYDNTDYIGSEVPFVVVPVDPGVCNGTPPSNHSDTNWFPFPVTSCDVMPLLAKSATNAIADQLNCTSSPPPNCDTVQCTVLSNNDVLAFTVLPCHDPPGIQLLSRSAAGSVRFNQTFTTTTFSVNAPIGSNPAILNISIFHHDQNLTLGIQINATIVVGDDHVPVNFVPYQEIPLNRNACSTNTNDSLTCRTMDELARYWTVSYANLSHLPKYTSICQPLRSSLCNIMNCTLPQNNGYNSLAFLPCTNPSGVHSYYIDHRNSLPALNFTLYDSGLIYVYNDTVTVNITLDHLDPNMVGFSLMTTTPMGDTVFNSPYVHIPLDDGMCTRPRPTINSLVSSCDIMPTVAGEMTSFLNGSSFSCTSSLTPDCNTVSCFTLNSVGGEEVMITVFPCNDPPAVGFSLIYANGTSFQKNLTTSQMLTTSFNGVQFPVYFTVEQHSSKLTIGLEIIATIEDTNVTFLSYKELPLDRTACSAAVFGTCAQMNNISQYINVLYGNVTASPTNCSASDDCQEMTCDFSSEEGSFNLELLPCSSPPAIRMVFTAGGLVVLNFTISNSEYLHMNNSPLDLNVTLLHYDSSTIGVQVDFDYPELNVTTNFIPLVAIPLETSRCHVTPGVFPFPVTSCDVMPLLAKSATNAIADTLNCTSSPPPNCDTAECTVLSNNDVLSFTVLPCHDPPGIQLLSRSAAGSVRFNQTFTTTTFSVNASIGSNPAFLNISIFHHDQNLTLGIQINATIIDNMGNQADVNFVPYQEIPLNRAACATNTNDSLTCHTMDELVRYWRVETANLAHLPEYTPECQALRSSLCNTINCTFPLGGYSNLTFLPCSNPAGFNSFSTESWNNFTTNYTLYDSIYINGSVATNMTLDHLGPNLLGFSEEVTVEGVVRFITPYIRIPLDNGTCTGPRPTINSLVSTCDIMPTIAEEITHVLDGSSLSCTSSLTPDCNTVSCFALGGEEVVITVLPCNDPPAVEFSLIYANGTSFCKILTTSQMLTTSFNGVQFPVYFTIEKHSSKFTIGLEIITTIDDGTNVTVLSYKELPLNRTACSAAVFGTCPQMNNISQYINAFYGLYLKESTDCSVSGDCQEMMCNFGSEEGSFNLELLPCSSPPAIRILFTANGSMPYDYTISNSEYFHLDNISLGLNVTLLHYNSSAIGIQVDFDYPELNVTANFIPLVAIPLDVSSCSVTTPPSTNNGTTHIPSQPSSQKINIAAAVAVPLVLVALAVVVACIVVGVIYYIRRKKKGQIRFKQLSGDDIDDEDHENM